MCVDCPIFRRQFITLAMTFGPSEQPIKTARCKKHFYQLDKTAGRRAISLHTKDDVINEITTLHIILIMAGTVDILRIAYSRIVPVIKRL